MPRASKRFGYCTAVAATTLSAVSAESHRATTSAMSNSNRVHCLAKPVSVASVCAKSYALATPLAASPPAAVASGRSIFAAV